MGSQGPSRGWQQESLANTRRSTARRTRHFRLFSPPVNSAPVHALQLNRHSRPAYVSPPCSAKIPESCKLPLCIMQIRLEFPSPHAPDRKRASRPLLQRSRVCIRVMFETWRHLALSVDSTALVDRVARSAIPKAPLQQLEVPSNLIYDALGCRTDTQYCRTSTRDLCPSRIVDNVCHQS